MTEQTVILTPSGSVLRGYLRLALCSLLAVHVPLHLLGRQPGGLGLLWSLTAAVVALAALALWVYLVKTRRQQPQRWPLYNARRHEYRLAPLELLLGIVGVAGNIAIFIPLFASRL